MASNLAADEETLGDVRRLAANNFYGIGSAKNQSAEKGGLLVRNQGEY